MADPNLPGGHHRNPISIDDDDTTARDRELRRLRKRYLHDQRQRNPGLEAEEVEVDEDIDVEATLDKEALQRPPMYIEVYDDGSDEELTYHQHGKFPDPSAILHTGERELVKYLLPKKGLKLLKGMTVELTEPISVAAGQFQAEFLKIAAIVRKKHGEVRLLGHLYTRARNLGGILERKLNEVVLLADVTRDTKTDWNRQAMVNVKPTDVHKVRVLRTTNTEHPQCGFDTDLYRSRGKQWISDEAHLVCRWQYVCVYKELNFLKGNRPEEWLIRRISEADADKPFAISDELHVRKWRGGNSPGGSVTPASKLEISPVIDLVLRTPAQKQEAVRRRFYNGGDLFSGAGGATCGMLDAGIKLLFAVDKWELAAATYAKNFKHKVHHMDIFDFNTAEDLKYRVDILHLSPPCQYWSPAHTVAGQNDEVNVAALFACGHAINKIRPRIFTIEQTFGILFNRFENYFRTFIGTFTSYGYSIRWKIVHFAAWGLCQKRKRLIVVGAAPGEHLPDFPEDTHFQEDTGTTDKPPYATVRGVMTPLRLRQIEGRYQHDVASLPARSSTSWDWNTQLSTITCSGGQNNYHWSGKRGFTIRELASLQGFPIQHSFEGNKGACVKQIGNAVPPPMARRLFKHIVKWLKIQDGALSPDDSEVQNSAARQRLEMIKMKPVVDPNDSDLEVGMAHYKVGSQADKAISVADSSDGTTTTGEEVNDGETTDHDGDDDAVMCDDTSSTPSRASNSRYDLRPLEQLPLDSNYKLGPCKQPSKQLSVKQQPVKQQPVKQQPVKQQPVKQRPVKQRPSQNEQLNKTTNEDKDAMDVDEYHTDAKSEASGTVYDDENQRISIVNGRRILKPVSQLARFQHLTLASEAETLRAVGQWSENQAALAAEGEQKKKTQPLKK